MLFPFPVDVVLLRPVHTQNMSLMINHARLQLVEHPPKGPKLHEKASLQR